MSTKTKSGKPDTKLSPAQIRILQALRDGKEATMGDIKERVGIGRDGKYNQPWLIGLHSLRDIHRALTIEVQEGDRKYWFRITPEGRALLKYQARK